LVAWLNQMEALEGQLALAKAQVLAEWDRREVWADDGALSGAVWLAHRGETSRVSARAELRFATRIAHMPATRAALEAGEIGVAKARLLADARRNDVVQQFDEAEADLVEWCKPLTVEQTGHLLRHWANTVRPDGPAPDPRDECELWVSPGLDGVYFVKGRLDAEWGALLARAINDKARELREQHPDPADGEEPDRSAAWRRGEALVELVAAGAASSGGGLARPSVVVVVDDVLAASQAAVAPLGSICEIDGAGRVLADTARRLACDSMVTLASTTSGVLLDLGRTHRSATAAQRKALLLRDQGCVFPGCDRAADWCEAHHIQPWEHEGETNLGNLALLCSRHHHLVHEGGFGFTRARDGTMVFTRPDGCRIDRGRPNRLPLRYPDPPPSPPPDPPPERPPEAA
jgi:hypothetical protein